ncbi:hypothetical protein C0992_007827 [Termitomyces sp. T32_za158]|nr:hypothetical protein C0992_007827 [Termitomyces sp. T32_za158]
MARNLQGLNVVHPVVHPDDNNDLLAGQPYPDLTAQLDLWSNLAFEDEGHDDAYARKGRPDDDDDDPVLRSPTTEDGHVNVVAAREHLPVAATAAAHFDLNALIAGFGIDPFSIPQHHPAPSLAQLLALNAPTVYPTVEEPAAPSPKRQRTRKTSVSTAAAASPQDTDAPAAQAISAAEDKRRRNTAASARFRLKKKEREAALEAKAKELEQRVSELERECEGLRRENGWLKGLVVGVTGAAQGPADAAKRVREED